MLSREGVVGALAAVGCTAAGGEGRFVAYDGVRDVGETVPVAALEELGIAVVGPDGEAVSGGTVATDGWLRPQLRNGEPTLPLARDGDRYVPANLSERGGH